ncbi:MAG: glycosyltransferase [Solirubrobacterales bacterium]
MSGGLTVLVDRWPELSETFIANEVAGIAARGRPVHVEAVAHAPHPAADPPPVAVDVLAEDSRGERLRAMAWLAARYPRRCLVDACIRRRWAREEHVVPLRRLAPLARRIARRGDRHLHAHFAGEAALHSLRLGSLLGLPTSVTAHAYEIYQQAANLPEKLGRARFAVGTCAYVAEHLRKVAPGADVHEIVMGVDPRRFMRSTAHPDRGPIVAVGRLVEKKGFVHLVEAAARMEGEVPIVIVGEGPDRARLQARIDDLGLGDRVRLAGALRPDRVRDQLESAVVLAAPCVVAADGDRDSMPVVVKEAMAMEVPVVASDEVGLPELVREPWGLLAAPGDADALARALERIVSEDPERRASRGRAGRDHVVSTCTVNGQVERLVVLIDRER